MSGVRGTGNSGCWVDLLYGSRLPSMCEFRAERGGRSKKHCDQDEKVSVNEDVEGC